jgi:heme-degrading monooxygenase HmoA
MKTPYYAVIFTSTHSNDLSGYSEMALKMEEMAKQHEGFLGIESVREDKNGITISYWDSLESIKKWKSDFEHQKAQNLGKEKWYSHYHVRIAKVEREYES